MTCSRFWDKKSVLCHSPHEKVGFRDCLKSKKKEKCIVSESWEEQGWFYRRPNELVELCQIETFCLFKFIRPFVWFLIHILYLNLILLGKVLFIILCEVTVVAKKYKLVFKSFKLLTFSFERRRRVMNYINFDIMCHNISRQGWIKRLPGELEDLSRQVKSQELVLIILQVH